MASLKSFSCLLEQCPSIKLSNPSSWEVCGHSRAGERTGLWIKPLKICLDAGLTSHMKSSAIFLSHAHVDHTFNLPTLVSHRTKPLRGQENLCGRPVFMPGTAVSRIQKLMEAIIALSDNEGEFDYSDVENIWRKIGYHPIPVCPGDTFNVPGLPNIKLEILKAYHNSESVGYGFSTVKKKIKKEFLGVDKNVIIAAKKEGMEISEDVVVPEVVFYCDSTIDNLREHEEWKKYPVVICECTGYPGYQDQVQMRDRFHTHLLDLVPIMKNHSDKQWILVHASMTVSTKHLQDTQDDLREKYGLNIEILRENYTQDL